jgi:hypothetical protein
LKTIVSWIFGDIDIDLDVDGDMDFDVSSVLSFKGVLHFLIGFSAYLSSIAYFSNINQTTINDAYQFTILEYVIATIVGIIFMSLLWYVYKFMMKLNHSTQNNPDFNECSCSVLTNIGNGLYVVLIKTPLGMYKKTFRHISNKNDISIGMKLKIIKNTDGNFVLVDENM